MRTERDMDGMQRDVGRDDLMLLAGDTLTVEGCCEPARGGLRSPRWVRHQGKRS